jgi:hypothetical protein
MNENDFSRKVAHTLNWGLTQIEEDKLVHLRASRQKALAAYRQPVRVLGLVTVNGNTLNIHSISRNPLFWLPLLIITAAIATYTLNAADDIYDDVGEVDAKILTGELPINAFLDKDFGTWVKESAE